MRLVGAASSVRIWMICSLRWLTPLAAVTACSSLYLARGSATVQDSPASQRRTKWTEDGLCRQWQAAADQPRVQSVMFMASNLIVGTGCHTIASSKFSLMTWRSCWPIRQFGPSRILLTMSSMSHVSDRIQRSTQRTSSDAPCSSDRSKQPAASEQTTCDKNTVHLSDGLRYLVLRYKLKQRGVETRL